MSKLGFILVTLLAACASALQLPAMVKAPRGQRGAVSMQVGGSTEARIKEMIEQNKVRSQLRLSPHLLASCFVARGEVRLAGHALHEGQ
jgi:hypothetical protein